MSLRPPVMVSTVVGGILLCGLIAAALAVACSGDGLQDPERPDGDVQSPTVSEGLQGTQTAEEDDARAAPP